MGWAMDSCSKHRQLEGKAAWLFLQGGWAPPYHIRSWPAARVVFWGLNGWAERRDSSLRSGWMGLVTKLWGYCYKWVLHVITTVALQGVLSVGDLGTPQGFRPQGMWGPGKSGLCGALEALLQCHFSPSWAGKWVWGGRTLPSHAVRPRTPAWSNEDRSP